MINIFNKISPFFLVILMPMVALAQIESTDYYTPGEQERDLMIIVHVWGEVNQPGKFIVRDGINLVEILSEAGGPTRYANLKNVYVFCRKNIDFFGFRVLNAPNIGKTSLNTLNIILGSMRYETYEGGYLTKN